MILGSSRECVFVYGAVFCGLSEELFRYGGRRWRRSARVATLCHHSRTYWHLGLLHPTVLCELGFFHLLVFMDFFFLSFFFLLVFCCRQNLLILLMFSLERAS